VGDVMPVFPVSFLRSRCHIQFKLVFICQLFLPEQACFFKVVLLCITVTVRMLSRAKFDEDNELELSRSSHFDCWDIPLCDHEYDADTYVSHSDVNASKQRSWIVDGLI
jgi:hypothetical protein